MNPVTETFAELFESLDEARKVEAEHAAKVAATNRMAKSLFTTEMFNKALQQANNMVFSGTYNNVMLHVTEEVGKAAGDTITYNVNDPATWEKFEPPVIDWSFTVPEPPKRKRKGKK